METGGKFQILRVANKKKDVRFKCTLQIFYAYQALENVFNLILGLQTKTVK